MTESEDFQTGRPLTLSYNQADEGCRQRNDVYGRDGLLTWRALHPPQLEERKRPRNLDGSRNFDWWSRRSDGADWLGNLIFRKQNAD